MDRIVYALCAFTCVICVALLLRGYLKARTKLLLWSTICFFFLAIANILTYIQMVIVPHDLQFIRLGLTTIGLSVLLYGMIKETV